MKRLSAFSVLILGAVTALAGCGAVGSKETSMSVIYGITAVLSLFLLVGYCRIPQKKDGWFLLMFISVLVVNTGYLALAISRSLDEALLANRLAYLGSVFLPLAMWMILMNITHIRYPKWITSILLCLGILVFLVAASPGYLDIYYQEVSFEKVNGVTVLRKVYGPWHVLFLFYLLGYFLAIVATTGYAIARKKLHSTAFALILVIAVFSNIGVWLVEQLVRIDFEILSVSYVISEGFLLGLHLLISEYEKKAAAPAAVPAPPEAPQKEPETPCAAVDTEALRVFQTGLRELTPTERTVYELHIAGKTTGEILEQLNIKENTLKFHNKNIYSKLGVSSRKQLRELSAKASDQ